MGCGRGERATSSCVVMFWGETVGNACKELSRRERKEGKNELFDSGKMSRKTHAVEATGSDFQAGEKHDRVAGGVGGRALGTWVGNFPEAAQWRGGPVKRWKSDGEG